MNVSDIRLVVIMLMVVLWNGVGMLVMVMCLCRVVNSISIREKFSLVLKFWVVVWRKLYLVLLVLSRVMLRMM